MRMLILLGAILALGATQLAAASSDGRGRTLHLKAVFEQTAMTDEDPAGESLGDTQIGSGVLTDAAGHEVGRFGVTCHWVNVIPDDAQELCHAWGMFRNGDQIELQGMSQRESDSHVWAIVGGTGRYSRAHGQASIVDRDETHSTATLRISR